MQLGYLEVGIGQDLTTSVECGQQVLSSTKNNVCVMWLVLIGLCSLLSPLQQQCHATDSNSYRLASPCSKIRGTD